MVLPISDIHTHRLIQNNPFAVLNLQPNDNMSFFSTQESWFSVGIHPWQVHTSDIKILDYLLLLKDLPNFKAIGECGLDKKSIASIGLQTKFFTRQILISEEIRKPLIIHCVGFFNEIINLKKQYKPTQNWIIHAFRGKPQLAQQLLKDGFYLSYGPNFQSESIKITPLDKLCIETDDSSQLLEEIYNKIAELKNTTPDNLKGNQKALNLC